MALTIQSNLIKSLQGLQRDAPFGIEALHALGISSALASHYVKSGWLARLGRGVFMFPSESLKVGPSLKFLATRVPGLHVGGKTALAWRGVRHNLSVRERLSLCGDEPAKLPGWFLERFPATYVTHKLFAKQLPEGFGLEPLPETPDGPLVSVPERALLELLSEVGVRQSVEEGRQIMEGVRSLRDDVLSVLLKNCRRVKVVRLCVQWAEDLKLPWAAEARSTVHRRRNISRSRWSRRLKDGTTLILKS